MKKQIAVLTAALALLLAGCTQSGTAVTAGDSGTTTEMPIIHGGGAEEAGADDDADENYNQADTEIALEFSEDAVTEIAPLDPESSAEQEQDRAPTLQLSYVSGEIAGCMNIYSYSYIWNGLCADGLANPDVYTISLYGNTTVQFNFVGAGTPDSLTVVTDGMEAMLSDDLIFEAEAGKEYRIEARWGDNSACYIFCTGNNDKADYPASNDEITAAEPYNPDQIDLPAETAAEEHISQGYNPNW